MSASTSRSDQELAQQLITLTEAGMPLVADPWAWMAERMQLSVDDTLALLQRLQDSGAIRRIAAVPNHYRLGYTFNGMTVWDVDGAHIDRLGQIVGNLHFVSHCYRRPRLEGWRYNLFAMVHGMNAEQIEYERNLIRDQLGEACRADTMLVSSRILKKTGLRLAAQRQEK